VYKVEDKDPDHVSRSYSNSFGEPAWMPWAMRIYDHVWIHAGDVTGPKCSHGCIILPVDPAQEVYQWSDQDTKVIVVESLSNLPMDLKGLVSLSGMVQSSPTCASDYGKDVCGHVDAGRGFSLDDRVFPELHSSRFTSYSCLSKAQMYQLRF